MKHATLLRTRRLVVAFLVGLLAYTFFSPSVIHADPPGNGEHPGLPVPGRGPRPLDRMPPAAANRFLDFVPPGLQIRELSGAVDETVSLPLTPGVDHAVQAANGRVGLYIETGTAGQPARLNFTLRERPALPTTVQTHGKIVESQPLYRFALEITEPGSGAELAFDKQVRLVADIRDLEEQLDLESAELFIAFQDEEDPGRWREAPSRIYQRAGLLMADVDHFSEWMIGARPERWQLSWNPPTVSAFSGAATYSYPFDVPAGRNGLQPSVVLSYSSDALNGRVFDSDQGIIGDGWSLAEISVVRVGVRIKDGGGFLIADHPDEFRLVLNGSGHKLLPEYPAQTATAATMRYFVTDAPGIRVTRYYDESTPNDDKIWWKVETGDGTWYRLGYSDQAEIVQRVDPGSSRLIVAGHHGQTADDGYMESATGWLVDTITDRYNNQIRYFYNSTVVDEDYDGFDTHTEKTRLRQIAYNYDQVSSWPPPATPTSSPLTHIDFRSVNDDGPDDNEYVDGITNIFVYHGNDAAPLREYRLTLGSAILESTGCPNYDHYINGQPEPRYLTTWTISSIQQYAMTDGDPKTTEGQGEPNQTYALPATTFAYDGLPNFHRNGEGCFFFARLGTVSNGYGADISFEYEHDGDPADLFGRGRAIGSYEHLGAAWYQYPEMGYSWHVSRMETRSQPGGDVSAVDYAYSEPCYNQWDPNLSGNWGVMAGATGCGDSDAPKYGTVAGFRYVTMTARDASNQMIGVQTIQHGQGRGTNFGRPLVKQQYNDDGSTLISKEETTYGTGTYGAPNFIHVDEVKSTSYHLGENIQTRVAYGHSIHLQGMNQYGNQVVVRDYGDMATTADDRTTITCYFPQTATDTWLVQLPALQRVYSGILIDIPSSLCDPGVTDSTLLLETQTIYVGNSAYNQLPQTNKAQEIRTGKTNADLDGAINGFISGGTTTYDAYGNPEVITTNTVATTTIGYDGIFHMYPVTGTLNATDVPSRTMLLKYYGINAGTGWDNGLRMPVGAVQRSIDVNNVTNYFEYDPFGRLFATYDSNEDLSDGDAWNGDPIERIRYTDNGWNGYSMPFAISTIRRPGSFPPPAGQPPKSSLYTTNVFYDGFGRQIQTRDRFHEVEGYASQRDIITITEYDARGNVACTTVPFSVAMTPSGYVTDSCTSKDHTSTIYDDQGRVYQELDAAGAVVAEHHHSINGTGFPRNMFHHNVIDANQHRVKYTSNARGELIQVEEMDGSCGPYWGYPCVGGAQEWDPYAQTAYEYDWQGNLTGVTDDHGNETTIEYDLLGRKTSMDDPDMGIWEYEYDTAGNLIWQEDAQGQELCFYYDSLNRMTTKGTGSGDTCPTEPDADGAGWLATYTYDSEANAIGQLTQVQWQPDGDDNKETFTFDDRSRLKTHTRTIDGVSYPMETTGYDLLERPTGFTYPNGITVTVSYDREGEQTLTADEMNLGGTVNSNVPLVDGVTYNARGQQIDLDLGNNLTTHYAYAGAGNAFRMNEMAVTESSTPGDDLMHFLYDYDDAGNITSLTEVLDAWVPCIGKCAQNPELVRTPVDAQLFTYDHLNRLETANGDHTNSAYDYSLEYSYDEIGNIIDIDRNGQSQSFTYPAPHSNRPHAVTGTSNPYGSFSYDANGNMVQRAEGVNSYQQTFDLENRLTSVHNPWLGATTTFAYDAGGQRTKTVEPDGTVTHFPFPNYVVEDPGLSSEVTRSTYAFSGQTIALYVYDTVTDEGVLYFMHGDHLGSVSLMSDESGAVVANTEARYLPFGENRVTPTADLTDRGYTGHQENRDIGLTYMNARFYSPSLNRFVSADTLVPDPKNPQSFNKYAYVLGNPLIFRDPSGHCAENGDESCWSLAERIWLENEEQDLSNLGTMSYMELQELYEQFNQPGKPEKSEDTTSVEDTITAADNPDPRALALIGIPLTGAVIVSELALLWAEVELAPIAAAVPAVGVPLEIVLGGVSITLIDFDVAYWMYTKRIYENPDVHQEFDLLPPWDGE